MVAMHEDALRGKALGDEGSRGLELGQEVGLRHVWHGHLLHSLKILHYTKYFIAGMTPGVNLIKLFSVNLLTGFYKLDIFIKMT